MSPHLQIGMSLKRARTSGPSHSAAMQHMMSLGLPASQISAILEDNRCDNREAVASQSQKDYDHYSGLKTPYGKVADWIFVPRVDAIGSHPPSAGMRSVSDHLCIHTRI